MFGWNTTRPKQAMVYMAWSHYISYPINYLLYISWSFLRYFVETNLLTPFPISDRNFNPSPFSGRRATPRPHPRPISKSSRNWINQFWTSLAQKLKLPQRSGQHPGPNKKLCPTHSRSERSCRTRPLAPWTTSSERSLQTKRLSHPRK